MSKNINRQVKKDKKGVFGLASFFGKREKPGPKEYTPEELAAMRVECANAVTVHSIFNAGVLLLDEVDLILHPLKSELNWPLGDKLPLDLTTNRSSLGLRWQIQYVILDAICAHQHGGMTIDLHDSRDVRHRCSRLPDQIPTELRLAAFPPRPML